MIAKESTDENILNVYVLVPVSTKFSDTYLLIFLNKDKIITNNFNNYKIIITVE